MLSAVGKMKKKWMYECICHCIYIYLYILNAAPLCSDLNFQTTQAMIPTSQYAVAKDATTTATAAASLYQQHAPPQFYNGLQLLAQPPYALPATPGQVSRASDKSIS